MYSDSSQTEVTIILLVWQGKGRALKVKSPPVKTCVKCNGCWQRGLIKMTAHIHMHSFVCSAWRSLPRRLNKGEEGSQGLWRMPGGCGDNTHTHRHTHTCVRAHTLTHTHTHTHTHTLKHTQWPYSLRPEVIAVTAGLARSAWALSLFSSPPLPSTHTHTQ